MSPVVLLRDGLNERTNQAMELMKHGNPINLSAIPKGNSGVQGKEFGVVDEYQACELILRGCQHSYQQWLL